MKLEVGMYVRFKDKRGIEYIRKIVEIPEDNRYASLYLDKEANYSRGLSPKNVIKASYNIIDILEVGDYVNGSEVLDFENKYIEEDDIFVPIGVITENCYLDYTDSWILEKDIKTIIPHEQMKQIGYKVGD